MIQNNDFEYLTLDGMPYVIDDTQQNWVFSTATKKWEKHSGANFSAVYPNYKGWFFAIFAGLPNLPKE